MIFDAFYLLVDLMGGRLLQMKLIHVHSILEQFLNSMPMRMLIEVENMRKMVDLVETLN
jgi:hypothetical protein